MHTIVDRIRALAGRMRTGSASLARALRHRPARRPVALPVDPFGEPPRESGHDPLAYRREAAKAPGPSTLNFH